MRASLCYSVKEVTVSFTTSEAVNGLSAVTGCRHIFARNVSKSAGHATDGFRYFRYTLHRSEWVWKSTFLFFGPNILLGTTGP
jgi:hypothetical protein